MGQQVEVHLQGRALTSGTPPGHHSHTTTTTVTALPEQDRLEGALL